MPLKKDRVLFTEVPSELKYKWFIDSTGGAFIQSSRRTVGGPVCLCVFVCEHHVCDSFGREGESPWMHLQPPPHPPLRSPAQWLSPFFPTTCVGTKHGWVSNTALHKWAQAAAAAPHPFEIVHVSGLHRSAYECQVVDFCRLLASLVWLNEQLKGKKTRKWFNNSTKTHKKCFSLTVRWFCQRAMCP